MEWRTGVTASSKLPKTTLKEDAPYGIHSTLVHGFQSVKSDLSSPHPLEISEKLYKQSRFETNFKMLRSIQGLHAPLKLMAERNAALKIQRLPSLRSSNVMLDALEGSDEVIGFEDILNDPDEPEVMGPPHMMMEAKLGLL
ncbi:proteasome maturation protein-like [Limulus polyphemus]|uniref:Proteasome maturation protein-like n=1 Tax=Limulus polyphemus TaxID=6850 RepID=A0ABM1BVR1_LIMPO|nr:proteasome maturation protein-like [Limulus polyphemus]XP_013789608.1 proteasome maturation protein-like [Limulus polyphemus]XP_013789609.1 proteasome maturation protein-like [Limulus polyphemus]